MLDFVNSLASLCKIYFSCDCIVFFPQSCLNYSLVYVFVVIIFSVVCTLYRGETDLVYGNYCLSKIVLMVSGLSSFLSPCVMAPLQVWNLDLQHLR